SELLIFLCKEYGLTIDFTGSILSIKRYVPPQPEAAVKSFLVALDPSSQALTLDIDGIPLEQVFRKIMEVSNKNLLFANELKSRPINIYLNEVPFDKALEKLAGLNGLSHSKSR